MNKYDEEVYRKIKARFAVYKLIYPNKPEIAHIIDVATDKAATAEINAAYNGARDDGGSAHMQVKLHAWLDGMQYIVNGKTEVFKDVLKDFKAKQDKDYAKYVELKAKFES